MHRPCRIAGHRRPSTPAVTPCRAHACVSRPGRRAENRATDPRRMPTHAAGYGPPHPRPLSRTVRERGCRGSGGGEGCSIGCHGSVVPPPRLRRGWARHASPLQRCGGTGCPRSPTDRPPTTSRLRPTSCRGSRVRDPPGLQGRQTPFPRRRAGTEGTAMRDGRRTLRRVGARRASPLQSNGSRRRHHGRPETINPHHVATRRSRVGVRRA